MPGDFGVPAAFGGVVAERGDVGELGLELRDELRRGDVVVALLAPLTELTTMFQQFIASFRSLTLTCPSDSIG